MTTTATQEERSARIRQAVAENKPQTCIYCNAKPARSVYSECCDDCLPLQSAATANAAPKERKGCKQAEYGKQCGLPCVEGSSLFCDYHISDKERKRLTKKAKEETRRAEIVKITPEDLAAFEKIKESGKPVERFAFTDLGNAERFQWRNEGKFVWTANSEWLAYENGVWIKDDGKSVERAMHTTVRLIELEVELYDDEEMQDACIGWAKRSESNGKINASLERASVLVGLARNYEDFDTLTTVLNLKNGEVNLCNS